MKTATLPLARHRILDYVELTKPRISVLVLFTVAAGALLAGSPSAALLIHTLIGTAFVAAGASALNQLLERQTDALMRRTENRPLPAGRLLAIEVWLFGMTLGVGGLIYLWLALNKPLPVAVAAFTFASYVFLYTPLKRVTTLNTLVGAVPGALPPVIGWTAVRGTIDPEIVSLFLLMFLWQVPHFLAIAWMYREDYGRAGLKMLPVADENGQVTARQMVSYCLAMLPVSLSPVLFGQAGVVYAIGAMALGLLFLRSAIGFWQEASVHRARRVLHASLLYLPVLLMLLLVEVLMLRVLY